MMVKFWLLPFFYFFPLSFYKESFHTSPYQSRTFVWFELEEFLIAMLSQFLLILFETQIFIRQILINIMLQLYYFRVFVSFFHSYAGLLFCVWQSYYDWRDANKPTVITYLSCNFNRDFINNLHVFELEKWISIWLSV